MVSRRSLLASAFRRESPPNVLLLLTDDQRADTISALGNPAIRTPNLDALARRGMVFRNAYCMGGNVPAVCTPSRNMMLSGRAYTRYELHASGDDPNFPDSMKGAGYETYHHGKRGNSAPLIQARFEINRYLDEGAGRRAADPGRAITDEAVAFLRSRDPRRPFFMYLAFETPHDPRVPRPEDLALYRAETLPLPANFLPVHPFDNGEMTVRDELLAPWPRTGEEIRRHLRDYYAVITGLDRQIGRILEELNARPDYANTIVIFSSDQGLALGSHGLMGKQSLYDHSMKAPLVIAGPGIRPGHTDALVYLLDIYPTVLDLTGIRKPAGLDGESFAPVLQGRAKQHRQSLFLGYRQVQRAIRDESYKLIVYPRINRKQLFDLRSDPSEMRDLAGDAAQKPRIERMLAGLRQWQSRLGDALPLETSEPAAAEFSPPEGEHLRALRKRWGFPD